MKGVSSIGFPDAPAATGAGAGKKDAAKAAAFDSFLPSADESAPVADDSSASAEELAKAEVIANQKKDAAEPEPEPQADALVLSSCLAVWQMLPPPVPTQPVPTEPSGDSETIATNSSTDAARLDGTVSHQADAPAEPADAGTLKQMPAGKNSPTPPTAPAAAPSFAAPAGAGQEPPVAPLAPPQTNPGITAPAQPETGRIPTSDRAGKPIEIKGSRRTAPGAEVPRTAPDGIPVAKEQRVMPDLTFHHQEKLAPAAFAEGETPSKPAHEVGREAVGAAINSEPTGKEESQGEMSGGHHEHPAPEAFSLPGNIEVPREFGSTKADPKIAASDTAQVVHEIERAIDRMRAQGGQRMEMRLPMRDGEEIVVKLRMEQGEVKATFQSGSEGLRQALETGWSQFAQGSPERAGKAAAAVFESPALQSGMGGFQQSPQERQRGGTASYSESDFASLPLPPELGKANAPARAAAVAPLSAALEIYA